MKALQGLLTVAGPVRIGTTLAAACLALSAGAPAAQAAAPAWKVIAVTGPTNMEPFSNERQTVFPPPNGTFTLTFGGDTTAGIAYDAHRSTVQAALNALPSVSAGGGSVSVTRVDDSGYRVSFDGGPLAGTDVPAITASGATVKQTPSGTLTIFARNIGGATSSGSVTVTGDLPAGTVTAGPPQGEGWSCSGSAGQDSFSCVRATPVEPGNGLIAIKAPVVVETTAPGTLLAEVSVSGGGAPSGATHASPITVSDVPAEAGVQAFWAGAFDENGNPETRAGAHPFSALAAFFVNTVAGPTGRIIPAMASRDVLVDVPAGFVANPLIAPRCPRAEISDCSTDAVVGGVGALAEQFGVGGGKGFGLANVLPPRGSAAQFTFRYLAAWVPTLGRVRPDDYGVGSITPNIADFYKVYGAFVTLWGQPGDPIHDTGRCVSVDTPGCAGGSASIPSSVDEAFLTNPTECSGSPLRTMVGVSSWLAPTVFSALSDVSPAITDCDDVPFDPSVDVGLGSVARDSATGLDFDLVVPQEGLVDPGAIATSHLRGVVVDLPEGLAVNPSAATGLAGCSDAQMAVGTDSPPLCPDGSKLGTVEVTSPLADHPVEGTLYLGRPRSTDPMSGEMLRLFVVARDDQLGLMFKLPGSATADPATGKLTATFENNPRLPFDHLSVKLKGGEKGVLATSQDCGAAGISTTLSPWSGTADVTQESPFDVTGDCNLGFAPKLAAGNSNRAARGTGTFSFRFSREDGEQWVDGLTAELPKGLLASVKDLPLCSSGQAAAGACPDASRIGTVDGSAGSGTPFVLEEKGSAYLTEGYKGCAYGLAVVVPVVAGPFDATTPETDLGDIVVRQAVCVDRSTAEVSVVSDPIPTIWHGIPLRIRSVTVSVDRPGFMLNPSDCSQKQVGATFHGQRGATSRTAVPFQTAGCASLPFRPDLKLGLTGRKQVTTGKHPGVKAVVTQAGTAEAGIEKVVVRLPKSLALDPENAQALCEFTDGTKPDLENHCPKGSIVGRARAKTPLLNDDLVGNVYFVKNIRIDPSTGNQIRTLPMIIVALRGEIAVNLKGESSTLKNGRLVNTFANVPDAPISQFNLNINGGQNGILAVTRTRKAKINLCAGRHTAEVDTDGQNARRHDTDIRMKTPCSKKQTRNAKRAAKQAARRR